MQKGSPDQMTDTLDTVLAVTAAYGAAARTSYGYGAHRLRPERATEAIGQSRVAAALAQLLVILDPAEAALWLSRANEHTHLADSRNRILQEDLTGLQRDSLQLRRARRGMPY